MFHENKEDISRQQGFMKYNCIYPQKWKSNTGQMLLSKFAVYEQTNEFGALFVAVYYVY